MASPRRTVLSPPISLRFVDKHDFCSVRRTLTFRSLHVSHFPGRVILLFPVMDLDDDHEELNTSASLRALELRLRGTQDPI